MPFPMSQAAPFHFPRWEDLPEIPLYMDQVLLVLEGAFPQFVEEKERLITPAMINNYVKQKLISPPEKKKYSREHVALLSIYTVLKRVLSISEITSVITLLVEAFGAETAYDLFCVHLEQVLNKAFAPQHAPQQKEEAPPVLAAALMALTGKLLVQEFAAEAVEE